MLQKLRNNLALWGPPSALMLLLFVASAQPKLAPPPGIPANRLYFSHFMPIFPGLLDVIIKKSAHFITYGILGTLMARAIKQGCRTRWWGVIAMGLTAVYAIFDELHQAFVPGRHPSLIDIGIDILGAAVFIYLSQWITSRIAQPHINEQSSSSTKKSTASAPAK